MRRRPANHSLRLLAILAIAGACLGVAAGGATAATTQDYIVVMEPGASLQQAVAEQRAAGNEVSKTFSHAIDGFVVNMTAADAAALRAQNDTAIVERDRPITLDAAPANDPFASPVALTGLAGTVTGSNASATKETGEPLHAGYTGGASVWYRWTPRVSGNVTMKTEGSSYDTLLGLYTGSTVGALTTIAANDDYSTPGGLYWSTITTPVTAGTTYAIAIDGYGAQTGNITLNWVLTPTTATTPDPPTAVTATSGNAQLGVAWTAPASNGGSPILSYTATAAPGGKTCTATGATTCTITGLTNGTAYTVSVKATNAQGASTASTSSAAATPTAPRVPGAPTGVTAAARNGAIVAAWTAAVANGSPILSYTATAAPGGATCTTTGATTCTISGLTNGTAYTVSVKATNALGTSPASANSAPATPATVVKARDIATQAWGVDRLDQRALPLDGRIVEPAIGNGVTAYIIDTGIRADHTEFAGRVGTGYSSITDGNGANDCNGHGTHVSGTVAGTTLGVAPGVQLIPVRVLDCSGSGTNSGVIAGIDWMIANHQAGVPAVANMSLGGGYSAALNAEVAAATADGITMVVAAGNSGADACGASPASEPTAITVGATDSTDTRASFSNYGSCVDVFAPGVAILSSWLDSATATATLSGTSMASPHVAGVAAVLLSEGYTNANVTSAITSSATPGIVNDPAPGSPNLLVSLANPVGNVTPVTPVTPTPAPAPAPGTTPAPTASLSHLHVTFRAQRGRANRGTYIISGSASDPGSLRITLTGRTGVLATKGKRMSTRSILNFPVYGGPFTISTPITAKGATLQIVYTPADTSIAPIISNPTVERIVAGTQTHLPAKG